MRIAAIEPTDLFAGSTSHPRQIVRVTLTGADSPLTEIRVSLTGPAVSTPEPTVVTRLDPGETVVAEVGVRLAEPVTEGAVRRVTAVAETSGPDRATLDGEIVAAVTGWTMWMVSHFHYDPVWWNTQAGFTETWYDLPAAEERRPTFVRTALDLVRAHLDAARRDEDYKFVLAEVDYLKPYWDVYPEDRADLRRFLAEDRIEIVGGNYNEPNTNLTHPESTIRNAVYGIGHQRDVVGGDPRSAWMLDVFGHDPAYPGLMADAGLTSTAWARGPFHMWGPNRHVGDNERMQFPAEFEWISPSGRGLLTAYMANHYSAGWVMEEQARTLEEATDLAYTQFGELRPVAATRNVLLPVGGDHVIPSRWSTEVHRDWNKRYVWPRFVVGLPKEFFAAVRAELGERRAVPVPQTRDMNPVYTGKDVSYIDTKQAQRAAEVAVLDAERLATLAALTGATYPAEAVDKAWRLLAYGAHHDAITGSESDQVYVDLLGGWREAYELGDTVRAAALDHLAARADTTGPGRPVIVANTLSWARDGITTVRLTFDEPRPGLRLVDDAGEPVPCLAEGVRTAEGGGVEEVTLTFLARAVPSLGYRIYHVVDAGDLPAGWAPAEGAEARNAAFAVTADPERGGALTSIRDLRTGDELIRPGGLGGELYLQEEHPTHPTWGEGPWHLLPAGPGHGTGARPASVRVEECPIGRRIVTETTLDGLTITGEVLLWDGVDRVDFRTHVGGSIGRDHLLRVGFDLDVPGGRPVAEVGFAAIGRPFGFPDADTAESLWTLDNPAHTWTALSATVRIALTGDDGSREEHAVGVAEVIGTDEGAPARTVLAALAAQGVTATFGRPDGPRYGALDVDSNLPDARIVLGGPDENAFAAEVLSAADPAYAAALAEHGRVFVPAARPLAEVWVPDTDVRGARDLPVLIVAGDVADLCDDLGDATIDVRRPAGTAGSDAPYAGRSVALLNAGLPGTVTTPDGRVYLNLMRACSTWPSGVWIDGPLRTAPDGSSLSWQHWNHTFAYSLTAGAGDWRAAGFVRAGQEYNHAVLTRPATAHPGAPAPRDGLVTVEPDNVLLSALKPAGNPLAAARPDHAGPADGVTVRVYESAGRPVTARIGLFTGITDAHRTDLLESGEETAPVSGAAPVDRATPLDATGPVGGVAEIPLGAADVATARLRPASGAGGPAPLGPDTEPVQPVFGRYWLHNKGPAPLGNLPTAVHLSPQRIALTGPERIRLTVAASGREATGHVELDVPEGLTVTGPAPDYRLAPGEFAEYELTVDAPGAAAGTYFVAARIHDDLGQIIEDVVTVQVGAAPAGDPLHVELSSPPRLRPGDDGEITVRLRSSAAAPIRGEAQLISPYGTWGPASDVLITPWTAGFEVAPGAETVVPFRLHAARTARPGAWWALVRVTYFGRLTYTETVAVEVTG
ncbi:glycoside hydrolase family 38 N-terminal domain-containing protein [Actinoallomurus rhizosphaericola]|uniref:glycoside hydrolase family 38 N-terminal domain-containing protein n=1 Tax=Actinoallomurus rhizosphaericola TaxID=2952536 RepID=UPI002091B770|nr:glycoside hydrolase family 38 C-terminal domain-containing protein [Actinoallomurus rhizosphaericola]MCO5994168.1 glycoside hydrolase [Actinoallomurus rhizosphaericola]